MRLSVARAGRRRYIGGVSSDAPTVGAALAALGIERLLLTVHDASFPAEPAEDVGRGSPYSFGARQFIDFAAELGFTGIQLGPQGKTSLLNASPFDGTLFARSTLSAALGPLADPEGPWLGVLPAPVLARLVGGRPGREQGDAGQARVDQAYVFRATAIALRSAFAELTAHPGRRPDVEARWRQFVDREARWLQADSLFEVAGAPVRHRRLAALDRPGRGRGAGRWIAGCTVR